MRGIMQILLLEGFVYNSLVDCDLWEFRIIFTAQHTAIQDRQALDAEK